MSDMPNLEIPQTPPYDYVQENWWETQVSPSTVHCKNTLLHGYFAKYLEQRAMSVFKFNMPEEWLQGHDFILYVLFRRGFFCVTELPKFGVVPINCTLKGYGFYYQPTDVIIANPALTQAYEKHIGTECALIRLKPDYTGIWDIVSYYADQLALISESVGVNLINTRLTYVFGSKNQNHADSFKSLYDMIAGGNPAVFYDKRLLNEDGTPNWQLFEQNVGNNYLVTDLLSDYRKVVADFDSMIGIPNANTDKKERLITDEVNANNQETYSLSDIMLETMQRGVDEAKKLFPTLTDFSVEYRNPKTTDEDVELMEEGDDNGSFEG